eukprot:scaffold270950_cov48-Prasinocladus_malaysianus.AAC.1
MQSPLGRFFQPARVLKDYFSLESNFTAERSSWLPPVGFCGRYSLHAPECADCGPRSFKRGCHAEATSLLEVDLDIANEVGLRQA